MDNDDLADEEVTTMDEDDDDHVSASANGLVVLHPPVTASMYRANMQRPRRPPPPNNGLVADLCKIIERQSVEIACLIKTCDKKGDDESMPESTDLDYATATPTMGSHGGEGSSSYNASLEVSLPLWVPARSPAHAL